MITVPFVAESTVRHDEPEIVAPSIRRIVANNPGAYTYHGTGTFIVGEGEVAVIDPGPDDAGHTEAILRALGKAERITHVMVTHTHRDHSPAARSLKDLTGATTYGFGPQLRLEDPDPTQVVFSDLEPPSPRVRSSDIDFIPDIMLKDGDSVKGSNWSLEALHTPGHASNHLCYFFPEGEALMTGDHVMGWSTSVLSPPDGNLGEYLASLERLLARTSDRRYLPAHGPEIDDPRAYVQALIAHRRERSQQILSCLETGPLTIAEMVPPIYSANRKELWPAAAESVYAHLIHLHEAGLVIAENGGPVLRASRIRKP